MVSRAHQSVGANRSAAAKAEFRRSLPAPVARTRRVFCGKRRGPISLKINQAQGPKSPTPGCSPQNDTRICCQSRPARKKYSAVMPGYRLGAAPMNRSQSRRLPRKPSSHAVCQLNRAAISRRLPLLVSGIVGIAGARRICAPQADRTRRASLRRRPRSLEWLRLGS